MDSTPGSQSFNEIVQHLLRETGASRTTLRLEQRDAILPVVAEALAPGIRSIKGATTIDLRTASTVKYLAETLQVLVQQDCLNAEIAPPHALLELYGVRAQMLAPIVRDGRMVGILSVHDVAGPRNWSDKDLRTLKRAADQVLGHLEARDEPELRD